MALNTRDKMIFYSPKDKVIIHYQVKDKRGNILQDNIPDLETAKAVCVAFQRQDSSLKQHPYRYLDIYTVTSKPLLEDVCSN